MSTVAERTARPTDTARPRRHVLAQLTWFAVIGVASTALHLGGFVLLRLVAPSQVANAVALLTAAVLNTWANRRWTFGVRGRADAGRHQVQGLLVFGLTLAMSSGGLAALGAVAPDAPRWLETAVVAVTTAAATAVKFAAMRWWVFVPRQGAPEHRDRRDCVTPEARSARR
ncbi:GtrA family protein [Phycicoccus sp. CSK15P-2]|uniref:GtrA family protein n=1 Tax=Phycicoccus sp. CSK15P-2 TaxID=2807627 RepID=UPI0027DC1960|nr:GtrA family protein [Phycicoccus sp. CSK15P-2]